MSLRIHHTNPASDAEEAYFRIQRERMADVPILNPALSVEAVDFQHWAGHWLGMIVTPWCMSILLVPGTDKDWVAAGQNKRRFIHFPIGDLAFLDSEEPELGQFQCCALFSPMDRFPSHSEAVMTARASMLAMLAPPVPAQQVIPPATTTPSLARRRFLGMGRSDTAPVGRR